MAPVIVDEVTLVGSRCGRFGPALRMLRQGKLNLRPMLSDRLTLREAEVAFSRAEAPGVLKVLLEPE
jgi:alcohol dehydrogenase